MTTVAIEESRADAELISAVRGGDADAYGVLFERHSMAARRLARQLVSPGDADDLVSEAFVKVLAVLQRGGGPDVAFRAYLLTAVRRLRVDRIRATSKLHSSDDMEMFDPGVPFRDTTIEGFENAAAARAFASLPERWQLVLWHTEVEEQKPADVAPLLGMSANSVSALAYRAREGLRQAFLNEHVAEIEGDDCRWTHDHLGPYIRNGLSRRDVIQVDQHLQECRPCAAIYLELVEVNSNLGAILAPLLLGSAATAYLASTASAVTAGGLLLGLLDRAKDVVAAHAPVAAVGGVAAAAVVAGGVFVALQDDPTERLATADVAVISSTREPGGSTSSPTRSETTAAERRTPLGSTTTTTTASTAPAITAGLPLTTSAPAGSPSSTSTPSSQATTAPTSAPTSEPTTTVPTTTSSSPTAAPTHTSTPTASPTTKPSPPSAPTSTATPTRAPTQSPTAAPTPSPTSSPTTTSTRDLSVAIASTGRKALYEDLAVTTTGIPAGESATVTISGINAMVLTSSDERCQKQDARLVCTVSGSAPIAVQAQRIPNGNASVTVVVTSNDGPDSNPADNSSSFVLDSN
ncbi:sigma-70 region 2 domain-containing protein [Nocardioides sp. CF8]|uniref:sigma-70 family RNA polymerase sigma factor n=1 Tax=Nocardioides sp. CF8 TaxID=110319 RepID=UPI00032D6AB0|nr:sigma-70 family RNA polymerase sigma factor [Nocardioides sp. CF8]EON24629.1 sigma-70 region 2 domain-containing protein [Nocardioides sp. CF8]